MVGFCFLLLKLHHKLAWHCLKLTLVCLLVSFSMHHFQYITYLTCSVMNSNWFGSLKSLSATLPLVSFSIHNLSNLLCQVIVCHELVWQPEKFKCNTTIFSECTCWIYLHVIFPTILCITLFPPLFCASTHHFVDQHPECHF
jgi:hypothetical protein